MKCKEDERGIHCWRGEDEGETGSRSNGIMQGEGRRGSGVVGWSGGGWGSVSL